MKGFDTLKVKSAVQSRSELDLSRSHLTTMNFGEIVPLCVEEVVPGDKISVDAEYFSRLAPLVMPTYGKFSFKTVAGYVPYHQIADDADAWLAGKTVFEGQTPKLRYITYGNLMGFYNLSSVSTTASVTSANCDFSYVNSAGTTIYAKLTKYGKMCNKVLNALGYAIPQGADFRTTSTWYGGLRTSKLSAMPLLAFFKLYNDYMSQSQRFNTSALTDALYKIKHGLTDTNLWTASTGSIAPSGIKILFDNLKLAYENDYFTSAWQKPNTPLSATENVANTDVPAHPNSDQWVFGNGVDNYLAAQQGNTMTDISQRALDMLQRFDAWVRRNNYSGSRAVQQVYSRFGIKTDDYRTNYAHVLKTDTLPVQVGDVTCTSESQSVPLGEYAGKGIMSGSNGISCECDDHGLFMILGYFTVRPMNAYGYDRRVLRTTPLDFYNPEFDGIGAEAISFGELYENPLGVAQSDSSSSDQVFGYTERYNSYRYGRDVITGEFRAYRNTDPMNSWHTGRNLADARANGDMVAQSSTMNTLEQTDSQYNRIFADSNGDIDHFYLTANFKVKAIRPMMNLNQVVRLGEGNTVVPRNGNVIS